MKPCLVQESDIFAKVRQTCTSDPFSLQPKQLQPDYVNSYLIFNLALMEAGGVNDVRYFIKEEEVKLYFASIKIYTRKAP